MRLAILLIFLVLTTVNSSVEHVTDENQGHAVQIVEIINHSFILESNSLQNILNVDGIKDRDVVVVSISGYPRQGKSFMLNFFVEYLKAQVFYSGQFMPTRIVFPNSSNHQSLSLLND